MERAEARELDLELKIVKANPKPPFPDHCGRMCVETQELLILDHRFDEEHYLHKVARLHRYVTADGETGGSGRPDPKEVRIGNVGPLGDVKYHRIIPDDPHCEFCEGRDMIAPEDRFVSSFYKPAISRWQRLRVWARSVLKLRDPYVIHYQCDEPK